jgi:hypothetical protein
VLFFLLVHLEAEPIEGILELLVLMGELLKELAASAHGFLKKKKVSGVKRVSGTGPKVTESI